MAYLGKPYRQIEIEQELVGEYGRRITRQEIMRDLLKTKNYSEANEWLHGLKALQRGRALIFKTSDIAERFYEREVTIGESN